MDAKSVMKTIELWARETRRLLQHEQARARASEPPQGFDSDGGGGGNGGNGGRSNEDMDASSLGLSSSSSSASSASAAWEELEEEVLLGPAHLDEIGASCILLLCLFLIVFFPIYFSVGWLVGLGV